MAWLNTGRTHFKKGSIPWNKGIKMSQKYCKKLSESHKGKPSGNKGGYKLSEEFKEKVRKRMLGNKLVKNHIPWNKDRKTGIVPKTAFKKRDNRITGKNNPNWKGGISSENHLIRAGIEFKLWHEAVFARDNWTCQKCGLKGERLCAHHINSFADCVELRTSIENGITVCKDCHQKFHRKYGYRKNNKEQIIEFLNLCG